MTPGVQKVLENGFFRAVSGGKPVPWVARSPGSADWVKAQVEARGCEALPNRRAQCWTVASGPNQSFPRSVRPRGAPWDRKFTFGDPKGGSSGPPSCLWRKGALLLTRFHVRPLRGCFKAGGISPQPPSLSLVQREVTGVPLGGLVRGGLLFLFPDMVFPVIIHKPHLLQEAS